MTLACECEHGYHRKSCYICDAIEDEKEIEALRDERDRLRNELLEEQANAESWRQQHENRVEDVLRISKELEVMREERDMLLAKLDEAVKLLKRRMHCDICECPGCLEVRKVIEG